MTTDVCIVSARRTPIGRFLGSLSKLSAVDLAVHAAEAAVEDVPRDRIDQVIIGNILSAGLGMNVARQVGVRLELPLKVPAYSVNMMCGSGLQAAVLAAQAIRAGHARVVLCGGTESMSNAPHLLERSRRGTKLGNAQVIDTILRDGLTDAFSGEHMAATAERLAAKYAISRLSQDQYALQSQQRCAEAVNSGVFAAELVTLPQLDRDEHPRPDTTAAQLAELKPAFQKDGTVTAGNASGINDGAAALVVAERALAVREGWPILAIIRASAVVGCDPQEMGLGPVHAIRELHSRHGVDWSTVATIEINEAFAAQALACAHELEISPDAINPSGGAIALGHPIGASGARLAVHLSHQIAAGRFGSGIASLCVGGGMGIAMLLENP